MPASDDSNAGSDSAPGGRSAPRDEFDEEALVHSHLRRQALALSATILLIAVAAAIGAFVHQAGYPIAIGLLILGLPDRVQGLRKARRLARGPDAGAMMRRHLLAEAQLRQAEGLTRFSTLLFALGALAVGLLATFLGLPLRTALVAGGVLLSYAIYDLIARLLNASRDARLLELAESDSEEDDLVEALIS
jgi:hypothetical protein